MIHFSQLNKCMTILVILLWIVPAKVNCADISAKHKQPKLSVIFRYDDYSAISPIDDEHKLIEILKERHAKVVFAVTPFICGNDYKNPKKQKLIQLTPEKIKLLKNAINAGVVEVALHGYSHQNIHTSLPWSEFAGEKYEIQLAKIKNGKRFLEKALGIPITSFVPPFNTYDVNTCKALSKAGIQLLSASLKGPSCSSVDYLPCTVEPSQLHAGVEECLTVKSSGQILIALFHPGYFNDSNPSATMTWSQLDDLMGWLSLHNDVRISTFADLADFDRSSSRFETNRNTLMLAKLLPQPIRNRISMGVYTTLQASSARNHRIIAAVYGFYISLIAFASLAGFFAARFIRFRPVYVAIVLCLEVLAVIILWQMKATSLQSIPAPASFVTAFIGGVLIGNLKKRE